MRRLRCFFQSPTLADVKIDVQRAEQSKIHGPESVTDVQQARPSAQVHGQNCPDGQRARWVLIPEKALFFVPSMSCGSRSFNIHMSPLRCSRSGWTSFHMAQMSNVGTPLDRSMQRSTVMLHFKGILSHGTKVCFLHSTDKAVLHWAASCDLICLICAVEHYREHQLAAV